MNGENLKYTTCGYHCHNMCILKVRIRDGVIVSCEPDDTVNPGMAREDAYLPGEEINKGMTQIRPCAKGYAQWLMIYDPDRVVHPMKRVGRRGEGKFARISWSEALDTIAEKLVETKRDYGPYSILHHPYSLMGKCSFPLAPWFGAGVALWSEHSRAGWVEPQGWVLGIDVMKGSKPGDIHQDEFNIFQSKLIVLWGRNPLTDLSGGWAYSLLRAKELGIPIICIDSRYTPSAEVLADQWIPIRPTTDAAMMIAMANIWFKETLYDREFVERWVEPEGLRRWRDYTLGAGDGVDKSPQWAEKICGVPAETIADFARLYARSKPVNLNVAKSLGRQLYGENATRAAMYLQALTGNTCTPGGTAAAETGNWQGHPRGPYPVVDWGRKPGVYNPPAVMALCKWPKAIDLRDKLDRGELSKKGYDNIIGNYPGNESPNIQMIILDQAVNHLNSLPDINTTIRAMKKVNFSVVATQYTDMPTARYADMLLPQIYTAYEGRSSSDRLGDLFKTGKNLVNYFLYAQKCIEPIGEVRANDWVWTQVAKRLGLAGQYNPRLAGVPDGEWDETVEELHREAYETWAARKEVVPLNPPLWQDFQNKPVFRWEAGEPYYPFKEDMEHGRNPFRGTASGKIEFYSEYLARGPDYLASNEYGKGSGRCYGPGELPPMAQMSIGGRDTFFGKDAVKYPLLMSSPHSLYRVHSFLDNSPLLRGECYEHALWISVPDAKMRGINTGDLVTVFNDLGEMVLPAHVTSKIVPGTVCVFHDAWYSPSKKLNPLMPDGVDEGGAANMLIHNEDLPDSIVGYFNCKALVQVNKGEGG